MLQPKFEMDRDFDFIIKKSFPYLIFSPPEFRELLAERLAVLCHNYFEKNDIAFPGVYTNIENMINEVSLGDRTKINIDNLLSQQNTIEENFRRINERLNKLEGHQKSSKNVKPTLSENEVATKEVHVGKPIKLNVKPTLSENEVATKEVHVGKPIKASPKLIIINCLKSSKIPLSRSDMAEITKLTKVQISNALTKIQMSPLKQHLKIDKAKRPIVYSRSSSKDTATDLNIYLYSWIDDK